MDMIRKHSPMFLIVMETHIDFHKSKSFWNRVGYVNVQYMDACGQFGGIWVLKENGGYIVTTVHDVFMDTIIMRLSLGTSSWYVTVIFLIPCTLIVLTYDSTSLTRGTLLMVLGRWLETLTTSFI